MEWSVGKPCLGPRAELCLAAQPAAVRRKAGLGVGVTLQSPSATRPEVSELDRFSWETRDGILRAASWVGRFLWKRHVCGAGPLGDRSLPGRLFESGALGARSLPGRLFGSGTRGLLRAGLGPASSGGRAMSPTAPCLRCRTARRSVPTPEAVRVRTARSAFPTWEAVRATFGSMVLLLRGGDYRLDTLHGAIVCESDTLLLSSVLGFCPAIRYLFVTYVRIAGRFPVGSALEGVRTDLPSYLSLYIIRNTLFYFRHC